MDTLSRFPTNGNSLAYDRDWRVHADWKQYQLLKRWVHLSFTFWLLTKVDHSNPFRWTSQRPDGKL